MKIVDEEITKEKFSVIFKEESRKFKYHVEWVKVQYEQLKTLRNRMPADYAIVQMDFTENCTCQSAEETVSILECCHGYPTSCCNLPKVNVIRTQICAQRQSFHI